MNPFLTIPKFTLALLLCLYGAISNGQTSSLVEFDFCGKKVSFNGQKVSNNNLTGELTALSVQQFYNDIHNGAYRDVVNTLKDYQIAYRPDDWLFYQLIRKTAQHISPKEANYFQYTLFKCYFLNATGFNSIIRIHANKMLLYVQCDENIYNIPNVMKDGKQYVCLNYHDYGNIDFSIELFSEALLPALPLEKTFSYKVMSVPDFAAAEYLEKDIHFSYYENDYHFKVKLSPQMQKLFTNYPVVDYESYFNIPLGKETYNSLIPQLKKNLKGMKVKSGVDYLMRFTRYAFLFETDANKYGSEKRLSPEQTLFYNESDCEDRVGLFFYLVKEIYDLPMIVLAYPSHVTIAVEFQKPVGQTVSYNGKLYTVCEPTPQKQDLLVGQLSPELSKAPFKVAYAYDPKNK